MLKNKCAVRQISAAIFALALLSPHAVAAQFTDASFDIQSDGGSAGVATGAAPVTDVETTMLPQQSLNDTASNSQQQESRTPNVEQVTDDRNEATKRENERDTGRDRGERRPPLSSRSTAVDGEMLTVATGGVAVGKGAPEDQIEYHGICRWVDATRANASFFVPTGSLEEFRAFARKTDISGANIEPCSCPSTNVTLTASTGGSVSARLASSFPKNGDGRPNPSSQYFLGRAEYTFQVASGCETWNETVVQTYTCGASGWEMASLSRNESTHDTSACPQPQVTEDQFSRYDLVDQVASNQGPYGACTADPLACQLYQNYLGRLPESGGGQFYSSVINDMRAQGLSDAQIYDQLAPGIANSAEARARAIQMSGGDIPDSLRLELAVVGAKATAGTVANNFQSGNCYTDSVDCGGGVRTTSLDFTNTDQAAAAAGVIYRSVLGRDADPAGLAASINFLRNGGTVEQLAAMALNSAEYNAQRGRAVEQTNTSSSSGSSYAANDNYDVASSYSAPAVQNNNEVAQVSYTPVADAGSSGSYAASDYSYNDYSNVASDYSPPAASDYSYNDYSYVASDYSPPAASDVSPVSDAGGGSTYDTSYDYSGGGYGYDDYYMFSYY